MRLFDQARRHGVYLGVYALSLLLLLVLAGPRLDKPSRDNHFSHLAIAWLNGRLDHGGPPPGFCSTADRRAKRCRGHRYDDWARIERLELPDGKILRAFPCRTTACKSARKTGTASWWIVGDGLRAFPRGQLRRLESEWFVSFPPGPALLMLPFVALAGGPINDVWLTCLVGALIPCLVLALLARIRDPKTALAGNLHREPYLLACGLAGLFATPTLLLASHGRVWFTAQVMGVTCLLAAIVLATEWRRPTAAGLLFALAFASRPLMLLALPVFAQAWWWHGRSLRSALRFVLIPLGAGLTLMYLNDLRFGSAFEFGHRFLDIRWQQRIQEHGLFSLTYVPRNLQCLATLLPQVVSEFPYVKFSIHGSALWLGCPWLLATPILAFGSRSPMERARVRAFCLSAFAVALPALCYQNSGQLQVSYRFGSDWAILLLVVLSLGFAHRKPRDRTLWLLLLVVATLFQFLTAYAFGRLPGPLFVTDPMGWPFESELR